MKGSDVYNLTNFYDEVLSHYLWHLGILGLSAVLIYRQWRNPFTDGRAILWILILAGIIFGFAYFVIVIEAATTPMGVPFAVSAALFILIWGRKKLSQQPLLAFFLVAYLVATALFLGWGIYWHGLPELAR